MAMLVRQCKILMLIGLAMFVLIATFTDLTENDETFAFVRRVMVMDTDQAIYRAVESPVAWTIVYWVMVTGQMATGLLYLLGAYRMIQALEEPAATFQDSKALAVAATTAAFSVWFIAVMAIGGEWFLMWRATEWDGQAAAFRYYMTALVVLIFVMQPDAELPRHRRRAQRAAGSPGARPGLAPPADQSSGLRSPADDRPSRPS
jgi:predicted small integral membrane protein